MQVLKAFHTALKVMEAITMIKPVTIRYSQAIGKSKFNIDIKGCVDDTPIAEVEPLTDSTGHITLMSMLEMFMELSITPTIYVSKSFKVMRDNIDTDNYDESMYFNLTIKAEKVN